MSSSERVAVGTVRFRIALIVGIIILGVLLVSSTQASVRRAGRVTAPQFTAVVFDFFVLFDPDSVIGDIEEIFPGRGREVAALWRTRQFEYAWLRSMTGRYVDFLRITGDALAYACKALKLTITEEQTGQLLQSYLRLAPWPDTARVLGKLRESGIRVITLTNFSPQMMRANLDHAGLTPLLDTLISTDTNHSYKPEPNAYRLGTQILRQPKERVAFAAFAAWDAAGAKSFGYPTVWVNRLSLPAESLGAEPDRTVADLDGLLAYVLGQPNIDADAARPERRSPR